MLKMTLINKKLLNRIILPSLLVLVIFIAVPIEEANAGHETIEIKDLTLKFVVQFNMTGVNTSQIQNFLTNTLFPPMRDALIIKLDNNFIEYDLKSSLRVTNLEGERFEVYPKLFFSGNSTMHLTALKMGLDDQIDDWKTQFDQSLADNNAFDIIYHFHKSIGSFDVVGNA